MILLTCIMVGVIFACATYLLLAGELKQVCMGIFLLGHGANLAIIAVSGSPIGRLPPVLGGGMIDRLVDPLPQALILTAIVIGFAVQAFLLTLLVITARKTRTLDLNALATDEKEKP